VSEYKGIPCLTGDSSPRVSDDSFLEFLHKNIIHMIEVESSIDANIYEGNILPEFRYDDTIIVGNEIERCMILTFINTVHESDRIITRIIRDLRIHLLETFRDTFEIIFFFLYDLFLE
jgi:hypothetical protein